MNYKILKTLAVFIFMGCSVLNTQAQIYVDASATTGVNDGTSWIDAFTDLQHALDAAAENAEIRVASGTYKPTAGPDDSTDDNRNKAFHFNRNLILKGSYNPEIETQDFTNPSILSGDFNGDDTVSDDGSITGNSENAYHVLITADLTTTARIEGFLITGGFADDGATNISYGDKTFFNNVGGGMYNNASSPSIVNTVFNGNSADSAGGMYNIASFPSIVNTMFSGNSASLNGGGMYNASSLPSMVNSVFNGNIAVVNGGGMYNNASSSSVINSTFSGNSANNGGGMYNNASSSPSIVNTVFNGNSADSAGGMYNRNSSPSIVNIVFSGNSASRNGGGMYNVSSSPNMVNTVFSGNIATNNGGGMYNQASSSSVINSTFSGNSANNGGGIRNNNNSSLTIYNSVFYGNGSDIANNSSSTTGTNNFSEHYTGTGFTVLDADPFLDSENPKGADEEWFSTDDGLQPKIGSPLINEGDTTKLPLDTKDLDGDGDTTKVIPVDITGRTRIAGATVDVGAYEHGSVLLSVKEIDRSSLDIYSSGHKTLVIHGMLNAKTTANVYSLQGKLVASKVFNKFSTSNSIDVSALSTGIYIVKMYNAKHQVHTKKLFIQ